MFWQDTRRGAAGLSVLITVGIAACGGEKSPPAPDVTPASIAISPSTSQTIASGSSVTFTAVVRNQAGDVLAGNTVSWTSSDASIAAIDQSGKLTAAKVGSAGISASVGSVTSPSVAVTVTPGSASQLALRTQPAGAVSTIALATQPVLEIRDAAGNLVTSSTLTVTASVGAGNATLSGTSAIAAVGGVVTYADLTLTGSGTVTLTFAATGVAAMNAAPLVVAPGPSIVVATQAATLTASTGGDVASMSISVTNGGGGTLRGLSVGPASYGSGQPTGWLAASLSAATAPASLTLTASPAGLQPGQYTASVGLSATNASNSPQTIAVTFIITPAPASMTYAANGATAFLLAPLQTVTPTAMVLDASGNPIANAALTFMSRAPSVASVDAHGVIAGVAAGSGWVVARASQTVADSVWLNVTKTAGPIVSAALSQTTWSPGDTIVVTLVLDTRGATIGGATILAGWSNDPATGVADFVDFPAVGTAGFAVTPSVDIYIGLVRLTAVAATGATGRFQLATFRLVARQSPPLDGALGWLVVQPQDVVALDQSALTAQTTSTRYPLIIK